MSEKWFTREKIEAEGNAGRFNSPWSERSFRSRILQDWLQMDDEINQLRARAEAAEKLIARVVDRLDDSDLHKGFCMHLINGGLCDCGGDAFIDELRDALAAHDAGKDAR